MAEACEGLQELICAYVDRELNDKEIKEVEKHLNSCSCCKKYVKLQYETKKLVSRCVAREEIPPGLRDRILSRLDDECKNPILY